VEVAVSLVELALAVVYPTNLVEVVVLISSQLQQTLQHLLVNTMALVYLTEFQLAALPHLILEKVL